jgi:ABC-type glutathione transport system ATPase component
LDNAYERRASAQPLFCWPEGGEYMRGKTAEDGKLLELLDPVVEAAGYEIVRLRLMGGEHARRLQIMAETPSGDMNVEDCAIVSRAVAEILDQIGLDAAAMARPVRTYSKGMTQKLGRAACFLSDRDLYILDEPLSGLDPSARIRVKTLLAQLKKAGRTLFFTSHALHDIEDICDHMVILHQGQPRFAGPPSSLLDEYGETSMERAFLRCIETPQLKAQ